MGVSLLFIRYSPPIPFQVEISRLKKCFPVSLGWAVDRHPKPCHTAHSYIYLSSVIKKNETFTELLQIPLVSNNIVIWQCISFGWWVVPPLEDWGRPEGQRPKITPPTRWPTAWYIYSDRSTVVYTSEQSADPRRTGAFPIDDDG